MDNDMDNMLELYLFETNSLLEHLDEILLNAEQTKTFSNEDVDEIFRIMHTIKGSSAMMQFTPLMTVSHRIEDLFHYIKNHVADMNYGLDLFDLMFQSSDFLKMQVENIENNKPLTDNIDGLVEKINNFIKTVSNSDDSDNSVKPSEKTPETNSSHEQEDGQGYTIKIFFTDDCGMENLRAFMLVSSVKEVCEDFTYHPSDVETNNKTVDEIIKEGFLLHFKNNKDLENALNVVKTSLNIRTYEVLSDPVQQQNEETVQENHDTGAVSSASASQNVPVSTPVISSKQSLINVNLTKLDKLMDIVGEIVITESMVTSCVDIQGLKLDNFTKSARQLRKLTDELQDIVMSIRMVPVSGVFQKMNRIVRDVAQSIKKDVKLTLIGETTEVDKAIVDTIGDPIMHMVRNSMDHGIELPEERIKLGKDPKGEIILKAEHTGSEVVITIRDDGRGIDTKRVLAKAIENNLLVKPESEYTQKEIMQFLLMPGFSTKSEVTELSGRGVGMDVVKKNIEKVGGTITITSEEGNGTCMMLKIPLTLSILDGMEVSVGESIFTVPITNIRQSFKVTKDEIIYDADLGEMVKRVNKFYPVLRLHRLYGIDDAATDLEKGVMMWLESGDKSYCLFVDELLGEHQVVLKPLPLYLNYFNVKEFGIAGCTIMGTGNISIILDILNLYDLSKSI